MLKSQFFFILAITLISSSLEKTKEEWKTRSIYQLLTDRYHRGNSSLEKCDPAPMKYCGGTFKGMKEHLDHIADLGFNAIWISPVVENTPDSYHGYHMISLTKINPYFGTASELKELVNEAHLRNIWVMVDVVANHVGPVGNDFSQINPFNEAIHYHDDCPITDWNNQWMVENCRLAGLPDLKHENKFVNDTLVQWIKNLVTEYDFDGIRIDTIPEVPKWFWKKFADSAGVYQLGEAFNANAAYVANYQDVIDALFNYPLYYSIEKSFCGDMNNLKEYYYNDRRAFKDVSVLGVFVENHDNARFLFKCNDHNKFINAIVFSILWEGIPVFYYGGEYFFNGGDDPLNRESLWDFMGKESEIIPFLKTSNNVRIQYKIWEYDVNLILFDKDIFIFKRNNVLIAVTNGSDVEKIISNHGFDEGNVLYNTFNETDTLTVTDGKINIKLEKKPKIYLKKEE